MKTYQTFFAVNSKVAVLITLLWVLVVGCDDTTVSPWDTGGDGRFTEVTVRSFVVDDGATISVDNFVGRVKYRAGEAGNIRVKATKRAARRSDLDRIDMEMTVNQKRLDIRTENPENLKRVSVDLEITAPPGARPQVATGVGDIDYQGRPRGVSLFSVGVGAVTLRLDADVSITVDLNTGVGAIIVGFPVDGLVRRHVVKGRIGSGSEGDVHVSTGVGNIYLMRQ